MSRTEVSSGLLLIVFAYIPKRFVVQLHGTFSKQSKQLIFLMGAWNLLSHVRVYNPMLNALRVKTDF